MEKKDKAYCGDALAQLIIGELKPKSTMTKVNYSVYNQYLSNSAMAQAYCFIFEYGYNHNSSRDSIHRLATEYEALLYDVFKRLGYEATIEFFVKTLVDRVDAGQITFL